MKLSKGVPKMSKIDVYRTHVEIHDYDMGDSKRLERNFSVYDPVIHKYHFKALYYDKETRTLYLPRGIDISFLEMIFDTPARVDMGCDPAALTGPIKLKTLPRDNIQEQAIQFMLSQGPYRSNRNYTMLSVNLNTGKGKSYCSVTAISYMQYKSMIITDSINILKQWKSFIVEYTNVEEDEICIITGTPRLLNLIKSRGLKFKVFLCSHSTIQSAASIHGWNIITELFRTLGIGLKFYDEAHLNFDNMFMIDCFTNTLLTYYITATPGRSNMMEDTIFGLYFKNVPAIDLFDKDNDPHTEYLGIRYSSHPTPLDIQACMNNYGLNRAAYTNYVVEKENFYYILHILIHMARTHPGKCLWYIGCNKSIIKVRDWIYENYPDLIGLVGIYTSIVTKDKEKQLDKKIILSTTKSAGAAIDIPNLAMTVVLAEPFKSKILAQQTLGRTRGQNTIYIEVVDSGFKNIMNQYRAKIPVFNKYATRCSEVVLTDSELKQRATKLIEAHDKLKNPMIFEDKDLVVYNGDD